MAIGTALLSLNAGSKALTGKGILGNISGISGLFNRSGCTGEIKVQRDRLAMQIDQNLSNDQKRELVAMAQSPISPTGRSMAEFYVGGADCKHKNVSPGDQRFLNQLPMILNQAIADNEKKAMPKNMIPAGSDKLLTYGILGAVIIAGLYFLRG